MKRIRLPDDSGEDDTAGGERVELPVKVRVTGGRVSIVSSRLLMFNRIAKVEILELETKAFRRLSRFEYPSFEALVDIQ